jgi:tRNA dimethylallyltransferase
MSKSLPPLAIIAGPTASGKSALALALAERANGVIVNADASQVYADLPILSAAPSEEDRKRAEHRLYGYLDGAEAGSVADWAERAKAEIADIQGSGKLPILVGGTGLYINTLLQGIAPVPPIDPAIREKVRSADVAENKRQLSKLDPASAARLNDADSARVGRALEVVLGTGKTLGYWQDQPREGGLADAVAVKPIILLPPREWLFPQCDQRFAAMIKSGAVGEVRRLLKRGLRRTLPVMQAIGVPALSSHIAGKMTLRDAAITGSQATRNYAKRQYTWFRNQPPSDWPVAIEPMTKPNAIDRAIAAIGA